MLTVCDVNVPSQPGWGWPYKPSLTLDPGDFGIPEQSLVKIVTMPVKGKGHGLRHYLGFCMQKITALSRITSLHKGLLTANANSSLG